MILIVGVLIAVGLVAAIAGVFLALGEQRSQNQATTRNVAPSVQARQPAREEQPTAMNREDAREVQDAQMADAQGALASSDTGVPAIVERTERTERSMVPDQAPEAVPRDRPAQRSEVIGYTPLPVSGEEQLAAGLASQYEALTRELREVHQKSNEIERRLSLLNEIATRFEQIQHGRDGEELTRSEREREINTETNLRPTPSHALDPYR